MSEGLRHTVLYARSGISCDGAMKPLSVNQKRDSVGSVDPALGRPHNSLLKAADFAIFNEITRRAFSALPTDIAIAFAQDVLTDNGIPFGKPGDPVPSTDVNDVDARIVFARGVGSNCHFSDGSTIPVVAG